jgi:hypothetical protein
MPVVSESEKMVQMATTADNGSLSKVYAAVAKRVETLPPLMADGVQATAFWAAVLLPFAHIPALHESLLGHQPELSATLLVVNAICLLIGHGHGSQS